MEVEVKKEGEEKPHTSRLDVKKENTATWLVKVPQWLAELWSAQTEHTDLGQVQIMTDPKDGKYKEAFLYLPEKTGNVPCKVFRMKTANIMKPMKIFSEDLEGNVAAEGSVKYKFDLEPVDKTTFRKSLVGYAAQRDARNEKSNILPRTKVLDRGPNKLNERKNEFTNNLTGDKRKRDPQAVPERRERLDKTLLMELIFSCFEEKELWTLKELNERCKQPVNWLKDVLAQVCQYNNKGQNKKMYELKPEYSNKQKPPGEEDDKDDSD